MASHNYFDYVGVETYFFYPTTGLYSDSSIVNKKKGSKNVVAI